MLTKASREEYIAQCYERFPVLPLFLADPLKATVEYYATCLETNSKASAYVRDVLGLSFQQARSLGIGFSDRTLGNQLPSNQTKNGKQIRSQLEALGLYKQNGREAMRGYVTVPLYDEQGAFSGIEGLRLDPRGNIPERVVIGTGNRRQDSRVRLPDSPIPDDSSASTATQITSTKQGDSANNCMHPIAITLSNEPSNSTNEEATVNSYSQEVESLVVPANVDENQAMPNVDHSSASTVLPTAYSLTPTACLITRGDRTFTIRGLERNMSSISLKVSIAASRLDLMHLDTVDLMRAAARQSFIRATAAELYVEEETIKKDLGWILLQIEDLRNQQIDAAKAVKQPAVVISDSDRENAMTLLQDTQLTHRIVADLDTCGMVGENFNKLAAYLAVVSRKLSHPLAILIQSSSSAGKTTLMDQVLAMTPNEDYLRLSNLTSQSLYYLDSNCIQHKTLAISEDHGLAEAAYALKLLQSEGKLTHATVAKGTDGVLRTQLQHVQGPLQLLLTSTSKDIDEELTNRCLVLTVDESREQTRAIQERQRLLQTRSGHADLQKVQQLRTLHHNAQRLLRPMRVYNNLVDRLKFASDRTRNRRDHQKYLTLIQSIALLHQHQRPITTETDGSESIEVLPSDIELANRLMTKILAQSLDELQPQTKLCLTHVTQFVNEQCQKQGLTKRECRFSRRAFREACGWTDNQVRMHLERLVRLEYVTVHRGKQGSTFVYELC
jgi:hypothetical protein